MECKAAVVVLVSRKGSILVIKRRERDGDPWSGHMAFPGGRRESDEPCSETAIRECLEEVGIKPCTLTPIGMYYPNNAPDMKVMAFLSCVDEEIEPKIQFEEVEKAFWIRPDELIENGEAFFYKGYRIWGMTYRILRDVIRKGLYKNCIK